MKKILSDLIKLNLIPQKDCIGNVRFVGIRGNRNQLIV